MVMEQIDYAAIIADLQAKRAALDNTISSLVAAQSIGALGQPGDGSLAASTIVPSLYGAGGEVPVGAFLGKSIPEAAKLCLAIVRKKLTTREIAEHLKKGGIESTAKNFNSIVHSILIRAASKPGSGIVKFDRSYWGLVEWLPAGMRGSGAAPQKRKTKSGRARKTRRLVAAAKPQKAIESANGSGIGVQEQIVKLLHAKPNTEISAQDVASSLGMRIQTAHFLLGKLVHRKQAEKTASGKFRAAAAA